jgi:hypothetical protein
MLGLSPFRLSSIDDGTFMMGGYTVFLGPITRIMITDVSFRSSSLSRGFETDGGLVA